MWKALKTNNVRVFYDSKSVVNQTRGEFEAKRNQIVKDLTKVKESIKKFLQCKITHIAKSDNC